MLIINIFLALLIVILFIPIVINFFNTIQNVYVLLYKFYINYFKKLYKYIISKKKIKTYYNDLTPTKNAENSKSYIEMLNYAIKNDNIQNIALTGPYGSGKSSILQTFKHQHPWVRWLDVSLATFESSLPTNQVEDQKISNEINNSLEKSILQQLFYQAEQSQIPESRFRKLTKTRTKKIIYFFIIAIVLITSYLFLFQEHLINTIFRDQKFLENLKNSSYGFTISHLMTYSFILSSIIMIYHVISWALKNVNLNSIKFKNSEISLNGKEKNSIFNKYLDEIIYFFSQTQYTVICIEDLDRFQNLNIFTKLRELNFLINNSKQVNRKIIFIYAIKDDMFLTKDRTKFFDFIIPVIPVVNSSNSKEKINEFFKKNNIENKLSPNFISEVSYYIDDMRLLTNILNEYILYDKILNKEGLKHENLFSIIIYKNMWPSDFADLQHNKGYVYNIFQSKKEKINEIKNKLQNEIDIFKTKIQKIEQEYIIDLVEFKKLILFQQDASSNITSIKIDNSTFSTNEFLADSFNLSLLKPTIELMYAKNNYYQNYYSVDISNYIKRINILKEKEENNTLYYYKKINELEREISKAPQHILSDLFQSKYLTSDDINEFFPKKTNKIILSDNMEQNITNHPLNLIKNLIINGWIDELYHHYFSYFYEGTYTKNDLTFLLGVKNHEKKDWYLQLDKFGKLIEDLSESDFLVEEILNFSFLEFLLSDPDKHDKQLESLFTLFSTNSELSINFINDFSNITRNKEIFLLHLFNKVPNICEILFDNPTLNSSTKTKWMKEILIFANQEQLKTLNSQNLLTNFINNHDNFISVFSKSDYRFIEKNIIFLNIKLKSFRFFDENKLLFDLIINEKLYEINKSTVESIIVFINHIDPQLYTTKNYSYIKSLNIPSLKGYINSNLEEYINKCFLAIDENNNNDLEDIIELLTNNTLSNESKERMISHSHFKINELAKINEQLWDTIILENKFTIDWENILSYYIYKKSLTTEIIEILNNNYLILAPYKLYNYDLHDHCKLLSIEIIESPEITNESFKHLAKSINFEHENISDFSLSNEKISIMVSEKLILFNESNFNTLQEKFSDYFAEFLNNNLKVFEENIEIYIIKTNCINNILKADYIENSSKINILVKQNIELDKKGWELTINLLISNKNLIKLINIDFLKNILKEPQIIINDKIIITYFALNYMVISISDLTDLLSNLSLPYNNIISPRKKTKIDMNEINLNFCNILKENDIISSFRVINNIINIQSKY